MGDRVAPFHLGLVDLAGQDEVTERLLAQAGGIEARIAGLRCADGFVLRVGTGKEAIAQVGIMKGVWQFGGPRAIGTIQLMKQHPQANTALETVDQLSSTQPLKNGWCRGVGKVGNGNQ